MSKILLATSIAPNDIENQQAAIKTWIDNDFEVISCNAPDEIQIISKYFTGVKFIPMNRDLREKAGKPYPFIFDIFQALNNFQNEICGIINSDIYLFNVNQKVIEEIKRKAKNNIIYAHRYEIDNFEEINDGFCFQQGIDIFIMNKNLLNIFEDDEFCIGQPGWDWWIPFICSMTKTEMIEFKNPIAYHLKHPLNWNYASMRDIEKKCALKYLKNEEYPVQKYYYMLHEKVTDLNQGISLIQNNVNNQSIFILSDGKSLECLESLRNQSHKNIKIYIGNELPENIQEDFILCANSDLLYQQNFVSMMIQEMLIKDCTELCNTLSIVLKNPIYKGYRYLKNAKKNEMSGVYEEWSKGCTIYRNKHHYNSKFSYFTTPLIVIKVKNIIEKLYLDEPFYICPAGYIAQLIYYNLEHINGTFLGFIDNNSKLYEQTILGHKVYPPTILIKKNVKVIIATQLYAIELKNQIKHYIKEENILIWDDII